MPDIKTVVLRDSWYDRGEYGSKPILGVAGPLSRDWDWSVQTPYSNFWGQPHASPAVKARAFRAFLVIVRAFSVTDSRIRALTLCAAHERLGMLLEVFDLCHTDFQHTLNVFQHLREIDLSFSTYRGKALNETYFKAGYMARILSSAKLLEKLALHFDMDNGRPLLPFALLFGESTIWPRLGSLVLTALHADPEELLDLFRRHHASLKHVGLSFVTIEGDQWDEAYESMQKCLQLESFVTNEPTYFLWLQLGAVKLGEFKGNWAENIHIARARSERKGMATGIWIELPDGFEMDDVRDSLVG